MGAKDQFGAYRDFIDRFYKANAAMGKILNYMLVVNDFMKHVNRCAVSLQCSFHGIDGHLHACAVATGLCYNDFPYCHKFVSSL